MKDIPEDLRRQIIAVLRRHEVDHAALFGSFARGMASEGSDIDILVEFKGQKSLLDLVTLRLELEDTLKKRVDVVTYRALSPLIRDRVLKEQTVIV